MDVLIAGAGPVGLTLALGLAKQGRKVLVCEKDDALHIHSRAPVVWPRTQEVLHALGILPALEAESVIIDNVCLRHVDTGRSLVQLDFTDLEPDTPFPRLLLIPQSRIEAILYQHLLLQPTAEVRFGTKVIAAETMGEIVQVGIEGSQGEETVEAAFLVGCDGAHSRVREIMGSRLEGLTYAMPVALGDMRVAGATPTEFPLISTARGLAVAIPMGKESWRLILPGSSANLDERLRDGSTRFFAQPDAQVLWQSEFRLHRRLCQQWVKGRMILAGDAAHLNSPIGGQGMNAGIQDAEWLLFALRKVFATGELGALGRYEQQRRRLIASGVNVFTHRLTKVVQFLVPSRVSWFPYLFRGINLLAKLPAVRRRILRNACMLYVPKPS